MDSFGFSSILSHVQLSPHYSLQATARHVEKSPTRKENKGIRRTSLLTNH